MIYTLHRFSVFEPFSGQYDAAWIRRDQEGVWGGMLSYWGAGIGDRRHYNEKVYNAELAFRFRGLNIQSDAEILEATMQVSALSDIDEVVNSKISVEDSISAASFPGTGIYANFVARDRLEAMVEWNDIASWGNAWKQKVTPNFASLIQSLVSVYGALSGGAITVFWGDRDGNTPVPAEGEANFIKTRSLSAALLRIVFEVVNVIEEPFPGIFYSFGDTQIGDATLEVSDEDIINDARVIVPRYDKELDYSVSPPALVPIDFILFNTDDDSQKKYGRRTRINKEPIGNWFHFASTYCEQTIEDCREPVPSMTLKVLADDDEAINKLLAIRIIDKILVTVDEAGIEHKFWIDSKVLTLEVAYILAAFKLREITSVENIPHIFRVGYDRIGDVEAVLG